MNDQASRVAAEWDRIAEMGAPYMTSDDQLYIAAEVLEFRRETAHEARALYSDLFFEVSQVGLESEVEAAVAVNLLKIAEVSLKHKAMAAADS